LTDRGIPSDRVSVRGMGEASPVASNDTAAGRQRNRRVEIVLSNAM
jgi:outer membrane protein OmpA-like peptidoglycan-associated protein